MGAANPIPRTLVINVGDLLARWTNDRFHSTPHRVVNKSDRERMSIVAFVDPDFDTAIVPVVKAGEKARYLDEISELRCRYGVGRPELYTPSKIPSVATAPDGIRAWRSGRLNPR